MKSSIWWVFLLANGVALIGVLNPSLPAWQTAATLFLVLEAVFMLLVGLPVFLYHFLGKKKPFHQSVKDAIESVLSFLSGWV